MGDIQDKSIDMILCDLPYGQTARNKWDVIIPFYKLWEQYNRITYDRSPICLFANGMFTSELMVSNIKKWKYNLIWNKVLPSGFLNSKKMPLRNHEDICIFYNKLPIYNPQMIKGEECHSKGKAIGKLQEDFSRNTNYASLKAIDTKGNMKYPKSILEFQKPHPSISVHPTQKPTELLSYLIKTYTNEEQTVLDNCMGSGSTGIACLKTNRNFIGIEKDDKYFEISVNRIKEYINKNNLDVDLEIIE